MKGLELTRRFFEEYGQKLISEDIAPLVSCGLVGNGSECFGFDDDASQDHDFQPGFCIWVDRDAPESVYQALTDSYASLPNAYLGYSREDTTSNGEKRRGVFRTSDFYHAIIGIPREPKTIAEWLNVPDYALAAATNGAVFTDHATDFTYIRNQLLHGMPRDVRLKRLAKHLALMAQSGQYNVSRCLKHGEPAAARLAVSEFVLHTASAVYHLNDAYPPFYKWILRGMRTLPSLSELSGDLSDLLLTTNSTVCIDLIEKVSAKIYMELRRRELTHGREAFLEPHALRVMEHIQNPDVRSLHVMA